MTPRLVPLTCALLLPALGLAPPLASGDAPPANDPRARMATVERVLAKVRSRPLSSDRNTPWVILHGIIAFEADLRVRDAESGEKVNAIEYLLERATYEERGIFREMDGVPTLPPRQRYFQVQDHADQVLMALADAGVPLDRRLRADTGRRFHVSDLLAAAERSFREDQELGWTLVAVSTYVPPDRAWSAADGREYRIEDLVALAVRRDPRRETEGGAHHLYGIAYALRRHGERGEELTGAWAEARAYLDRYVDRVRHNQQEDSAFSAAMLRGSRPPRSPRELVSTTGHTLEWLSIALSPNALREPWVGRAVDRLCEELEAYPLDTFSDGGIYHAAHALRRYADAVRGARSP